MWEAEVLDTDWDEDGAVKWEAEVLDTDWVGWTYCNKEFPLFFYSIRTLIIFKFLKFFLVPTTSINYPEATLL